MSWEEYVMLFDKILEGKISDEPYDKEEYLRYVVLNYSRLKRWLKKGELKKELIDIYQNVVKHEHWTLITEPWCADAANLAPFIYKISQLSRLITFEVKLRDSNPGLIDNYLTNGTKSIPILAIRDEKGNDKYTWGPRPVHCQERVEEIKKEGADSGRIKEEVQRWYNKDKGISVQEELLLLFEKYNGPIEIQDVNVDIG